MQRGSQQEHGIDTSRFFCNPYNEENIHLFVKEESLQIASTLFQNCQAYYATHKSRSYGSLYSGSLGALVYLPWKMARLQRQLLGNEQESNKLLAEAQRHVERAVVNAPSSTCRRVTLLESSWVGSKVLQIAIWHDTQQTHKAVNEADNLAQQLAAKCHKTLHSAECEVLYGRAGALQAILFLRRALANRNVGHEAALTLANEIVQQGIRGAAQNMNQVVDGLPLLWEWHDTKYLGAAHGVVGILHTLLCLEESELKVLDDKYNIHRAIQESIYKLQNFCWLSGNLDSSINASHRVDRLVHWCHGATGHILLLNKAFQVYGNNDYKQLAQNLAHDVVWKRGLLRKGVGLCHGISGSAYALLAAAGVGQRDSSCLARKRAHAFARFAWEHLDELEGLPDQPYCLYNGMPALSVLFMDLIADDNDSGNVRYPLYDHD